jgi:hypothetical protein
VTTIVLKRNLGGATNVEVDGVLLRRVLDVRLFPRDLRIVVTLESGEIKNGERVRIAETFVGDNITITLE